MEFLVRVNDDDQIVTDEKYHASDLMAAETEVLHSMVQIIGIPFDGHSRNITARIQDKNRNVLATMSLSLIIQDVG